MKPTQRWPRRCDLALHHRLTPLFCCGEPLTVREAGTQMQAFVARQIERSLFHLNASAMGPRCHCIRTYLGDRHREDGYVVASQEMHAFIRSLLAAHYGSSLSDQLPVLYGGSVKAGNASELFSCPDVDGGLVGGASLVAGEFEAIMRALK